MHSSCNIVGYKYWTEFSFLKEKMIYLTLLFCTLCFYIIWKIKRRISNCKKTNKRSVNIWTISERITKMFLSYFQKWSNLNYQNKFGDILSGISSREVDFSKENLSNYFRYVNARIGSWGKRTQIQDVYILEWILFCFRYVEVLQAVGSTPSNMQHNRGFLH